jgi:hypothetical protein
VGEETVLGTNPRLAQLRLLLGQARAMGVDFPVAWPAARGAALRGLRGLERDCYARALAGTREAWRSAYEGQASGRVDWALCELQGYASDGELDTLSVA